MLDFFFKHCKLLYLLTIMNIITTKWITCQYFSFFTSTCLPNDQNFRLVQIQSICRRQNKCDSKIEICAGKGRKH